MAKKKKNKEIVVFESNTKKLYRLIDGILDEITSSDVSKNTYNVTYMPGNSVMYSSVEIPMDSEDDEISIITNKTYENLGLDIEKDYKISYAMSNASQGINTFYNVFVVDNEAIDSNFKDVAHKIQYIDYIDMEPLAYQTLYSNNIIDSDGVQIFIYMHHDYGTLCVYKDGELISYRVIEKLSTKLLHAAYCNDLAERIQENVFINDLEKYGFDHENAELKLSLNKVLHESLKLLNNTLLLTLKNAQLENVKIEKVVVGTDKGLSSNFLDKIKVIFRNFNNKDPEEVYEALLVNNIGDNEYSLNVGEFINMQTMDYKAFVNIKNYCDEVVSNVIGDDGEEGVTTKYIRINPFVLLCFLRAKEQLKNPSDVFNISPFLRPPPFIKRYSGKLSLAIAGTVAVMSLYPLYNYAYASIVGLKTSSIQSEIPEKQDIYNKINNEINQLEGQIKRTQDELNELNTQLQTRHRLLNNIYDKKVNYQNKTQIIMELSKLMNASEIKTTGINIKDSVIILDLKGSAKGITNFLKIIGTNDKYQIDSRELLIKNLSEAQEYKEYTSTVIVKVER